MAEAYTTSCCTSITITPIGPTSYRQARSYETGSLVDLWLPVNSIPAGPSTYYFYNPSDGICYMIDYSDATSQTPGTILGGWQTLTPELITALCTGSENLCVTGINWATGSYLTDDPPTLAGTTRQSNTFDVTLANPDDYIVIAYESDDLLLLLPSTANIGFLYESGPDRATWTIPTPYVGFTGTEGYMYLGEYNARHTDGTNTVDNVYDAAAMQAAGFNILSPTYTDMGTNYTYLTRTQLESMGLMTSGSATLKLVHVLGGVGFASVVAYCEEPE